MQRSSEHRPKLYPSPGVKSFCLITVRNMATAEGAPDVPCADNPEQQPSRSEIADLKRIMMESQAESREREKRLCVHFYFSKKGNHEVGTRSALKSPDPLFSDNFHVRIIPQRILRELSKNIIFFALL